MSTVPRPRALDGAGHPDHPARLGERQHVVLPRALVDVGRDESAGLVREKRVDADHVAPLEVLPDDLVGHRQERQAGALPALDTRLLADAAHPFVGAGRSISRATRGVARPELRIEVVPPPEELTEQRDLLAGGLGLGGLRNQGKQSGVGVGWP